MDNAVVDVLELAVAAVAVSGWIILFGLVWVRTRPRPVSPAQPAPGEPPWPPSEPGGHALEPPAVVALLTGGWVVTDCAAESTLLDLAARGYLDLRPSATDPEQAMVHLRGGDTSALTGYEQLVLQRVGAIAARGAAPMPALALPDRAEAAAWRHQFRAGVVDDARARGLSRPRLPAFWRSRLLIAAIAAAAIVTAAVGGYAARHRGDLGEPLAAGFLTGFGLLAIAATVSGERDTAAGRLAASRWLALRGYLRAQPGWADLAPTAAQPVAATVADLTRWGRQLAYGNAIGGIRSCAGALGKGDPRRIWSASGGRWRLVRVRYPRLGRHYGRSPRRLAVTAVLMLVGGAALALATRGWADHADQVGAVGGVLLAGRGGYALIRTTLDGRRPVPVRGEVLLLLPWRTRSAGRARPRIPVVYYLVVDAGAGGRTTAWALPAAPGNRLRRGDRVVLSGRSWSRLVQRQP